MVTADALHTQHAHADWLVTAKHAAYLLMVKGNQPTLHQQLRTSAATGASRHCTTSATPPSPRTPPRSAWGTAARAMASLRNLAICILRAHGHRNIAAALRRNARDATRVLPLLGITSP